MPHWLHPRAFGVLLVTAALAACADLPTDTEAPVADPSPVSAASSGSKNLKKGGGGPSQVGRIRGTWIEPSDDLIRAVEAHDIEMKDSDFSQIVSGLDLVVNECTDLGSLQLRAFRVEDGEVAASVESDPGVLLSSGPEIISGGGGGGSVKKSASCDPGTLLRYTDWGVSGVSVTDPDNMFPAGYPNPDNWVPVTQPLEDEWIGTRGVQAGSGPTFLKAKKAFVPAVVVYDGAQEWVAGGGVAYIGGGFKNEGLVGFGSFAGPVVVIGVMPGDNVSDRAGKNAGSAPGAGVIVIQFGPE